MTLWILLAGCSAQDDSEPPAPDDTDTTPGTGPRTLTVTGGFGGGALQPGTALHVWADVDPQTRIVSWSGDLDVLDLPAEWNSPGVMPDRDVTLVATLETVPAAVEDRSYALDAGDRRVLVVPQAAPVGGVVFLHGAAYSVEELGDNAARTVVMHLAKAGWAVAALASSLEASAGTGGWDASLDVVGNSDLRNVESLVAELRADGTFPADGPVFAWGMSSGGQFAHTVGAAGLVDGVVAHCAPGTSQAMEATTVPTAWYLAAEDRTFPNAVDDTLAFQGALTARGVTTDRYVHPPTPLYDERFTRVAGVDIATSAALAAALRASGAVDAEGAWQVAGSQVDVDGLTGADALSAVQRTAVRAEIEIMAADHELYDDVAARMVAFLEGAR